MSKAMEVLKGAIELRLAHEEARVQIERQKGIIDKLINGNAELKQQADNLDVRVKMLEADLKDAQIDIDDKNTTIGKFVEQNAQLKEQVERLYKEQQELQEGFDGQEEGMSDLNKELVKLQQQNAELRERAEIAVIQQNAIRSEMVDMSKRLKEAEALNARFVKLLKRMEWQEFGFCPDCENDEDDGHANNCELGNLLAEVRE